MKTFKVAIAGTHSTGKTTFADGLRQALSAEGFTTAGVSDLGEECRDAGFNILHDHTPQSTLWIMTTGVSRELSAALNAQVVIVDRPVPDALGYYRAALAHRDEAAPERWAAYLLSFAKHHSATYDLIFNSRLDLSIPLGTNKPRDPDGNFRKMADAAVADVLTDLGIESFPLTFDNAGESVAAVLARVRERMSPTSHNDDLASVNG